MVGLPYGLVNDPKTILKKKYVDEHFSTGGENSVEFTGSTWYKIATIREVNKAIGQCIRDNNDYASIFLVDSRFLDINHFKNLPKWL